MAHVALIWCVPLLLVAALLHLVQPLPQDIVELTAYTEEPPPDTVEPTPDFVELPQYTDSNSNASCGVITTDQFQRLGNFVVNSLNTKLNEIKENENKNMKETGDKIDWMQNSINALDMSMNHMREEISTLLETQQDLLNAVKTQGDDDEMLAVRHPENNQTSLITSNSNQQQETYVPFQVSILVETETGQRVLCSGSIIRKDWILTAAICFPTNVTLDAISVRSNSADYALDGEVHNVTRLIKQHYSPRNSNLALLKVEPEFSSFVSKFRPPVLADPTAFVPPGIPMVVSGWPLNSVQGNVSHRLSRTEVLSMSADQCVLVNSASGAEVNPSSPVARLIQRVSVKPTQICAANLQGRPHVCKIGNAGSPLFLGWTLYGVMTTGPNCDGTEEDNPSVYTSVGSNRDWIEHTIEIAKLDNIKIGKSVYTFYQSQRSERMGRNWETALQVCRERGMRLAVIEDQEENVALTEYIISRRRELNVTAEILWEYWVGLNDRDKEGEFLWTDQTEQTPYRNWAPNEPNDAFKKEDCATIVVKESTGMPGRWNDDQCNKVKWFICEAI